MEAGDKTLRTGQVKFLEKYSITEITGIFNQPAVVFILETRQEQTAFMGILLLMFTQVLLFVLQFFMIVEILAITVILRAVVI